jgi:N-carbamoyl-L-amino-acid hydrolase
VLTGSHIDSVPGGGQLDGALGVVAGLEALRRLHESGANLARPVELVAFTDEEGRFGGMLGSQAMSGQLTPEAVLGARDLSGVTLVDAMKPLDLDALHVLRAARSPSAVRSFVELHIEQGPVLDRAGIHVGVVEGIVGLFKWECRLLGAANHAGTTPMNMRRDAFQGLAEFAGEIDRILEENGGEASVATIGRVALRPGAANVVPARVEFTLEVRDIDPDVLAELGIGFRRAISAIARRRGLMFEYEVLSEIDPVSCDRSILAAVEAAAASLGAQTKRLPSGAAHDAQMMAELAPIGMIFVPSKDGRSHSPAEWTSWESIEIGANCLLRTLYALAT